MKKRKILNNIIPIGVILMSVTLFFNSCEEEPQTLSVAKDLTSLAVQDISSNSLTATINGTTVSFTGEAAAGTTSVTIQDIVVSDKATANKAIGDALPVNNANITVTAEDGITQNYTFSINVAIAPVLSSDKAITAITINDGTSDFQGVISGTNITFGQVGFGVTEVTLTSIVLSPNASGNKSANAIINVDNSTIVVTAEDGSTQTYSLTIISKTLATLTNLIPTNVGADNIAVSTSYAAGNNATSEYGFVYSSVISGNGLVVGDGVSANTLSGTPTGNSFNATLQNLTNRTSYYVRAYATNSAGTAYSNEINPTTVVPISPVLGSLSASGITPVAATFSVPITLGSLSISEYGVVYSIELTGEALTTDLTTKIVGTTENLIGSLTVQNNRFTADTQYYARAYVITSTGTIYSNNYINFRTKAFILANLTEVRISSRTINSFIVSVNHIEGNTSTIDYGFVYSSMISGNRLVVGDGVSASTLSGTPGTSFNATLSDLIAGTTYYIRAYASNSAGTNYSDEVVARTLDITSVSLNNFQVDDRNLYSLDVSVNHIEGNTSTIDYGFVYSSMISGNRLVVGDGVSASTLSGTPGTSFNATLSDLIAGTTYYIRAYASNSAGTDYSDEVVARTLDFTSVSLNNFQVDDRNLYSLDVSVNHIEGNTSTIDYGFVYSSMISGNRLIVGDGVSASTLSGTSPGTSFNATLSDLIAGTTYYIRAYAINSAGTDYSDEVVARTLDITSVSLNNFQVDDRNLYSLDVSVNHIEGNTSTIDYGFVYSSMISGNRLVVGDGVSASTLSGTPGTSFNATLSDLIAGTTYYIRAYASNSAGTDYSDEVVARTLDFTSVSLNNFQVDDRNLYSLDVSVNHIEGNTSTIDYGFVYSSMISGNRLIVGDGVSASMLSDIPGTSFNATLSDLIAGTTYYIRAYASNSAGTNYSDEVVARTLDFTSVSLNNFQVDDRNLYSLDVSVNHIEGNTSTIDYGFVYSSMISGNRLIVGDGVSASMLSGTPGTSFNATLSDLIAGTTYYIRAYAINSAGTNYSDEVVARTLDITSVSLNNFQVDDRNLYSLNVSVNHIEGNTSTIDYGFVYSSMISGNRLVVGAGVSASMLSGTPGTSFNATLSDLIAGTTYYIRAYASNSAGTNYSDEVVAMTLDITSVSLNNFQVDDRNLYSLDVSVNHIEGNTSTSNYGFVYSSMILGNSLVLGTAGVSANTLSGTPGTSFNATLSDLIIGTTYYIRAYATNSDGTTYSNEINSTTLTPISHVLGTLSASGITPVAATFSVPITTLGSLSISEYGVVYSTALTGEALVISLPTKIVGTTENPMSSLTVQDNRFTADTQYYARAYATTSEDTVYSNNYIPFRTEAYTLATLTGVSFSDVTDNSFTVSADHIAGNSPTTSYGVRIVSSAGVPNENNINSQLVSNRFSSNFTGLVPGQTYTVTAYAENSAGQATAEGSIRIYLSTRFSMVNASNINVSGATLTATINPDIYPTPTTYDFVYSYIVSGEDLTRGAPNTEFVSVPLNSDSHSFETILSDLFVSTTYYVRAVVTNDVGDVYSDPISFRTATIPWSKNTDANWGRRTGFGSFTFNNRIWVLGGSEFVSIRPGNRYNDIWSTADGNSWQQVSINGNSWSRRRFMGALVHNNEMWIIGGDNNIFGNEGNFDLNDVWKSSDGGVNWEQLSNLRLSPNSELRARNTLKAFPTVSYGGYLWGFGGAQLYYPNDAANYIIRTLTGSNWNVVSSVGTRWGARFWAGAVVYNNSIWVLGGNTTSFVNNSSSSGTNDVWRSTNGVNWTLNNRNAPWSARYGLEVRVFKNRIWVMGGGPGDKNDVWYSSGTGWHQLDAGSTHWSGRENFGSAVLGEKLYIFGGSSGSRREGSNDVWHLELDGVLLRE